MSGEGGSGSPFEGVGVSETERVRSGLSSGGTEPRGELLTDLHRGLERSSRAVGAAGDARGVDERGTRHPTVSAVIPTLNEAGNISYVLERLPDEVTELIIVDGHSTDGTVSGVRSIRPDARIVHQDGVGKGNALWCGIRMATGDITVLLDADGSTDPAEIPRFTAALLDGYDFAKGTRFAPGGGSEDITHLRRLGNRALVGIVNTIWSVDYTDLCYGFNAFWTRAARVLYSPCNGFEVETLLGIRAAAAKGLRVVEVPSFESSRRAGASNLHTYRDGMRVLRTILAEWLRPV